MLGESGGCLGSAKGQNRKLKTVNRKLKTRQQMPTILEDIIKAKYHEVERDKAAMPIEHVRGLAEFTPPPRNFLEALSKGPPIRLIAEVKKASPSAGIIRADFDPVQIAKTYEAHGASCISVLTDKDFFQGSLDYLRDVRAAVGIPVLRKDFVIDPYQVFQARAAGADAVLLIAECLDDYQLQELHDLIEELEMTPLVEIYEPANLRRVLDVGAQLIGINNRDLHTFQVDLGHCMRLRKQIPAGRIVVGESGIRTHTEAVQLQDAGLHAMLVGETLMRKPDIGQAVDELLGT
jgi:indole-3-glycerol phosphate synthase